MVRRRRDAGFTLVELLVSLALATVGLLGLLQLQIVTVRGNVASRSFLEAVGLAQEGIERAGAASYASLPLLAGTESGLCADRPANTATACAAGQTLYTRTTTVTAAVNTTDVRVDVSWPDPVRVGVSHAVTLRTTRSP